MPRKRKSPDRHVLLETRLSELTALVKDLSPQARVEISFEQYEDEDELVSAFLNPVRGATIFEFTRLIRRDEPQG